MAHDLTYYLDPEHDTIREDFIPEWYVVKVVANNSRNIVAAFTENADEADIVRCVTAGEEQRYLIHA